MKTYLFSYRHQGAECVFEIRADSADDARKRVARLQYATLDGELMAKIPASSGVTALLSPLLNFLISIIPSKGK
ncbi:hypothetical protein [Acidovorax sp.]|uniref:hypothetical protein n=1 Tax=Acidovorax sp. TaxID=1872122 RepID=UPI0025BFF68E|nr:hypothetical protein [Acidovorax sp.]